MKQQWSQSAITRLYKGLTNIKHAEVLAHEVEQTVWWGRQWSSATNSLLSACSQSGGDALSRQHVSLSLLQTPSTLVKDSVLFDNYHIYSANPHLLVQLYNTESMRARICTITKSWKLSPIVFGANSLQYLRALTRWRTFKAAREPKSFAETFY